MAFKLIYWTFYRKFPPAHSS